MTTATTPTTELEAVNLMLGVIGESPITSLDNSEVAYAVLARQILSEISRTVQVRGWHFNTEKNYPLTRTLITNEIPLPLNCLRVDTVSPDEALDVVQRGQRLYDRDNHTFVFTKDIRVEMVILLPFTDLPESARYYVAVRAARVFQARTVGAESLYQYTAVDERDALSAFKKAEGRTAGHNMLTDSYSVARVLQRN